MKKMSKASLVSLSFLLSLVFLFGLGCNTVEPIQKSNLTAGMVKKEIVEGITTQNEILQLFGAPNIITHNKTGNEVWTYDKVSVERSASSGGIGGIGGGAGSDGGGGGMVGISGSKSSVSARTFTLMIEFDDNAVVKRRSYRASSF